MPDSARFSAAALAALLAAACLFPDASSAELYAVDRDCGCVYAFRDTTGVVVSPDTLNILQTGRTALDHEGRVLIAGDISPGAYVARLDPDTEVAERLFPSETIPYYVPVGIAPDEGDDIYVLLAWSGPKDTNREGPSPNDFIALLHDGADPADVVYVFPDTISVIDMKVRPLGPDVGNVVVLLRRDASGDVFFAELQRTVTDTLSFYQAFGEPTLMPSDPRAFAFEPDGGIVLLDFSAGLARVNETSGYVTPFGSASGPGLRDITIASNGDIYVANTVSDRIRAYDPEGSPIVPPFGSQLNILRAITTAGFTPTPEGENVHIEPCEDVEFTFGGITDEGFTTTVAQASLSRTSPEGNILPAYAEAPGARAGTFTYVSFVTDAVYTGLLQSDVLVEGSRLFFATGVGDTFRDFTVVGSVEDARGTIPRFSEMPSAGRRADTDPTEVVLVEDTRELPQVTAYKFWRLERVMSVPDTVPFCPWGAIYGLRDYVANARTHYDAGEYGNALDDLSAMNAELRDYAGWCIPESSNAVLGDHVGRILAHSKTLMYSIDLERWAGVDEAETQSVIALSMESPAQGECRVVLSGPVGTEVAVRLYAVSGRLVATLFDGPLPKGGVELAWDGTDASGRRAASGVYFAKASSGGESATSKVVYLR